MDILAPFFKQRVDLIPAILHHTRSYSFLLFGTRFGDNALRRFVFMEINFTDTFPPYFRRLSKSFLYPI